MKKKIVLGVVTGVLLSVVTPSMSMAVYAEENSFENRIENEIEEKLSSDVTVNSAEVQATVDGDNINIEVTDGDKKAVVDIDGEMSNLNTMDDNIQVSVETNDEAADYSVSFGSLEEKKKMDQAIATDNNLLEQIEKEIPEENQIINSVTDDELVETEVSEDNTANDMEYSEIQLATESVINEMPIITTEEELAESDVVLTNLNTGEESSFSVSDGMPSAIPLIAGFAIAVSGGAAASLIKMGAAIVIGGALGFVVSHTKNKSKRKNYSHYAAKMAKGKLVAYKGLSYSAAASRLRSGGEIWSTSKSNALKVSKGASPLKKSTGSELHRKKGQWRFHHFHPAIRKVHGKYKYRGTHSFYGTGVYG